MIDLDTIFKQIEQQKSIQSVYEVNDKVLIIDGMNTFIRSFSINSSMNLDGIHVGGITGFLTSLGYCIKLLNPTRCIIVFDGKGGSVRKRKIYSEYKENRKLKSHLNRIYDFTTPEEEYNQAMNQLSRLVEYLNCLPILYFSYDNIEADDLISFMSNNVFKSQVIIMSTDRDFIQLINDRISIWNAYKKKLYNVYNVKEDYEFNPKNYLYFRLIDGDKSDNIPGIKGIGIKTIQKNIEILNGDNIESFDFLLEHLNMLKENNKIADKLYNKRDELIRNYKLMQLINIDEYIDAITQSNIRNLVQQKISSLNNFLFKKLSLEDKIYHVLPNIDMWLNSCFSYLNSFTFKK